MTDPVSVNRKNVNTVSMLDKSAPPAVATTDHQTPAPAGVAPAPPQARAPDRPRWAVIGLVGLRLAIGFEFLWAFLDKTFGLGYTTTSKHAWIHGGSPTKGFLSGANVGPFQGIFRHLATVPGMDWLFMIGLLGIGLALILGVALRPAAFSGALLLLLMWAAVWEPAKLAGGQPTGSTNPIVDEHIVEIFGLMVIAALATWGAGYLGRRWAALPVVESHSWLR
jgi:thiosulfate dehydrogenase (quinone) large subunit